MTDTQAATMMACGTDASDRSRLLDGKARPGSGAGRHDEVHERRQYDPARGGGGASRPE